MATRSNIDKIKKYLDENFSEFEEADSVYIYLLKHEDGYTKCSIKGSLLNYFEGIDEGTMFHSLCNHLLKGFPENGPMYKIIVDTLMKIEEVGSSLSGRDNTKSIH